MATRSAIAIDLGRDRVRALVASGSGRGLVVDRTLVRAIPDEIDRQDPGALGKWLANVFRSEGLGRQRVVVALSREDVSLKRLTLPTTDADELPEMTRLVLSRELTFDADDAVIDFVPVGESETGTTVVAAAVPHAVVDFVQRVADAANLSVERVSLRCLGTTTLIGSENGVVDHDTLVVDVTGESVEFNVISDGWVMFSRAAATTNGVISTEEDPVDAAVTETRRTWMSYRITQDSRDVDDAVVLGDESLADPMTDTIGRMLDVPARAFGDHPLVSTSGQSMGPLWPLAGLLLEPALGRPSLNFAQPRRAPDRAAHRRQRVLMAGLIVVALMIGAWVIGKTNLDRLGETVSTMQTERSQKGNEYLATMRDEYLITHLEQWTSVDVDWLDHMAHLTEVAPGTDRMVLDSWTGTLTFRGVQYDRKADAGQRWGAPHDMIIVLDGEAADRATADGFRESLVEGATYRATSSGSDSPGGRRLPFGFTYRLATSQDQPRARTENSDEEGAP